MPKLKILLVEDEPDQSAELAHQLTKLGYEVTGIGTDLTTALGLYYSQQPDMAIVDIYLNGKPEGIAFAKKIHENPQTLRPFIFLTGRADLQTFEEAKMTLPYSYLLKPFNPIELQYAIELAIEKDLGSTPGLGLRESGFMLKKEFLFVKKGHGLVKIQVRDVEYVEVQGKYSKIETTEGTFLIQKAMKSLLPMLGEESFIRTHRNFAINVGSIRQVFFQDDMIVLNSGKEVPVSQSYRKTVSHFLRVVK